MSVRKAHLPDADPDERPASFEGNTGRSYEFDSAAGEVVVNRVWFHANESVIGPSTGSYRVTSAKLARQPAVALPHRDPRGLRRLHDAPTRLCNALDQQESTLRRQPRILVDVHSGLRSGLPMVGNQQFPRPTPDEQPS